ncbi:MAG: DUF262 domain-containing protein [Mariniphaga sp.]
MNTNIITISEYFSKGTFVIPNYQRGYKWGVPSEKVENNIKSKDLVGGLMESLFDAFRKDKYEYFLQGITVMVNDKVNDKMIFLIDGQQRTTTLFILLVYLNSQIGGLSEYIKRAEDIVLRYDIRKDSHNYLKELSSPEYIICAPNPKLDIQDIFYFKKAINTIKTSCDNFVQSVQKDLSELKSKENNLYSKFSKAISGISSFPKDNEILLSAFTEYLLNNVRLLYIPIENSESGENKTTIKATKIFKMMNGHQAQMKVEELIKSAILSQSSRNIKPIEVNGKDINSLLQAVKEKVGEEWVINSLRSKYAREWDKWLYWWNQKIVVEYFGTEDEPMGLLIEYFYYWKTGQDNYSKNNRSVGETFDAFKNAFLTSPKHSKNNFLEIRKLQKTFEDWYEKPQTYNRLGLILKCAGDNKKEALKYFITMSMNSGLDQSKLLRYANYLIVGATHKEIIEDSGNLYIRSMEVQSILSQADVYNNQNEDGKKDNRKELAFRQLLRMNMEMDSELNRKFDFSIWKIRSLEHIHPKSKVYKEVDGKRLRCIDNSECKPDEENLLDRAQFPENCSEHCIGNLFLLAGDTNSEFGKKDFQIKKTLLFSVIISEENKKIRDSLKLLHTASAFAEKDWTVETILKKKDEFIKAYSKTYPLNSNL